MCKICSNEIKKKVMEIAFFLKFSATLGTANLLTDISKDFPIQAS